MTLEDFKQVDLFNPSEEHKMLRQSVREFVQSEIEPQAHEFDRKEEFNLNLFKKLGDLGLHGLTVQSQYGGVEMDALASVIVHEELSWADPGLCLAYLAHSVLCANNLAANGSDEQKARLLPKLCSGEFVGCMAMSEPQVGTDVLGMTTVAKKTDNGYIINGRKMWITNGTVDERKTPADVVLLYAKSGESQGKARISTFLIERGHTGYTVGQKIKDKTGMRASNTAELVFENCMVPNTALVGEEGESITHMMKNLEIERLALAAMSIGMARRCLHIMNRYAREREAFGKPLSAFGQIQKYLGESYAEYMAARTYVYDTGRKLKLNQSGQRLDSDGVKIVAATMAKNVADRAMQVLGGYGYVGEYVVERMWRDSKLIEIGGGTLEAHQKNIANDLGRLSYVLN